MKARGWKWIGAGVAAATLATTGILLWLDRRESAAKAALAAEIRAERAKRPKRERPVPTPEELETAAIYARALAGLKPFIIDEDDFAFTKSLDAVPWGSVPDPVPTFLAANAGRLGIVDEATARDACRFPDTSIATRHSVCHALVSLLAARGHAFLVEGDPVRAVEEVRRLIRVGADLATAPVGGSDTVAIPTHELQLIQAEQHAARLLSAVATAPELPAEAGPALVAAARAPWGSAAAHARCIDFSVDSADAWDLLMLEPGAKARLEEVEAKEAELEDLIQSVNEPATEQGVFGKLHGRLRGILKPSPPVPTAAGVRWRRDFQAPILAAVRRRETALLAPEGPHEKLGGILGFLSPRWFRHTLAEDARIAVARAAAAIRAFHLREGRPPGSLEELVPSVLGEVPLDPFDGKPLHYEVAGEGWSVASRTWKDTFDEDAPPAEVRFPRKAK